MAEKSSFTPRALPTVLHHYAPRLVAVEHLPDLTRDQPEVHNFIIFLGGLTDGLRTVHYPLPLAASLAKHSHSWAVVELLLSSSYTGWQTTSLDADAAELAKAISYFRSLSTSRLPQQKGKIVLLGHSTGCQIATHYLVGPHASTPIPTATLERPPVDGIILQAGISDREGIVPELQNLSASLELARQWVQQGRGDDQLPGWATEGLLGGNPSARRWLSLASDRTEEADDDYFSSDLSDQRVQRIWGEGGFGGRRIPVLVLLSENDEYMPAFIDKAALLNRWAASVKNAGGKWGETSGLLKGARHNLNNCDEQAFDDLISRVDAFVRSLQANDF